MRSGWTVLKLLVIILSTVFAWRHMIYTADSIPEFAQDEIANTQAAVDFCKAYPQWRLSLQTHKLIAIP